MLLGEFNAPTKTATQEPDNHDNSPDDSGTDNAAHQAAHPNLDDKFFQITILKPYFC
jgi:hypothetical protein